MYKKEMMDRDAPQDPENLEGEVSRDGMEDALRQDADPAVLPEVLDESQDTLAWQDDILSNCRLWTEQLLEIPGIVAKDGESEEEEPDLYSFYEEVCALRSEFRKSARRSHEIFGQFGQSLEGFQDVLSFLTRRLDALSAEQGSSETLARQRVFLQVVELYERLRRFGGALEGMRMPGTRPRFLERIRGKLKGKEKAPDSMRDSVVDGFSLILSHFEEFLAAEGVSRIETVGRPFDPTLMQALAVVETDTALPDTVIEEIEGGYLYGEQVLKLARVTVAKERSEKGQ